MYSQTLILINNGIEVIGVTPMVFNHKEIILYVISYSIINQLKIYIIGCPKGRQWNMVKNNC